MRDLKTGDRVVLSSAGKDYIRHRVQRSDNVATVIAVGSRRITVVWDHIKDVQYFRREHLCPARTNRKAVKP